MFNIGIGELVVILIAALVVLGPKRLPELARGLGKFLREFRRQTDEVRSVVEREFYRMDQDFEQATAKPPRRDPPDSAHDADGRLLPLTAASGPLDASTASTQAMPPAIEPPWAGQPVPFEPARPAAISTEPQALTPSDPGAPTPSKLN